jgi:hypothetical protein
MEEPLAMVAKARADAAVWEELFQNSAFLRSRWTPYPKGSPQFAPVRGEMEELAALLVAELRILSSVDSIRRLLSLREVVAMPLPVERAAPEEESMRFASLLPERSQISPLAARSVPEMVALERAPKVPEEPVELSRRQARILMVILPLQLEMEAVVTVGPAAKVDRFPRPVRFPSLDPERYGQVTLVRVEASRGLVEASWLDLIFVPTLT